MSAFNHEGCTYRWRNVGQPRQGEFPHERVPGWKYVVVEQHLTCRVPGMGIAYLLFEREEDRSYHVNIPGDDITYLERRIEVADVVQFSVTMCEDPALRELVMHMTQGRLTPEAGRTVAGVVWSHVSRLFPKFLKGFGIKEGR